jgi:hypothetical protein
MEIIRTIVEVSEQQRLDKAVDEAEAKSWRLATIHRGHRHATEHRKPLVGESEADPRKSCAQGGYG